MKRFLAPLLLCTSIVSPSIAMARPATISIEIQGSFINNVYMAVYVTKPDGSFDQTLWVAGGNSRYYGDLRGWLGAMRASSMRPKIDGITGASLGSGRGLTLNIDFADAMIDAGYKVHVETVSQGAGDFPDDAVVPISSSRQRVAGIGYVSLLEIKM